jgi:WW domain-containing oxidoreductase
VNPNIFQTNETVIGLLQVNFLSHWLLANELIAIERERRASNAAIGGRAAAASGAKSAEERASSAGLPAAPAAADDGRSVVGEDDAGGGRGSAAQSQASMHPDRLGDGATRLVMVTSLTHRAGALQWHDKQSRHR